jgi:hypothetical protein
MVVVAAIHLAKPGVAEEEREEEEEEEVLAPPLQLQQRHS